VVRRLKKFSRLTSREQMLFLEALLLHIWIGMLLKIVPFRRIPRLFGSRSRPRAGPRIFDPPNGGSGQSETPMEAESRTRTCPDEVGSVGTAVGSQQSAIVENIRDAVQRAGQVSPWRNRCLVSSLAGRCMLRRRQINSQIHLGIAKNAAEKTIAHAWLEAEGYEVVRKHGDYHDIYIF